VPAAGVGEVSGPERRSAAEEDAGRVWRAEAEELGESRGWLACMGRGGGRGWGKWVGEERDR
jgi:hypothetical protein